MAADFRVVKLPTVQGTFTWWYGSASDDGEDCKGGEEGGCRKDGTLVLGAPGQGGACRPPATTSLSVSSSSFHSPLSLSLHIPSPCLGSFRTKLCLMPMQHKSEAPPNLKNSPKLNYSLALESEAGAKTANWKACQLAHWLVRNAAETCPAQCVTLRLGKASRGGWDPLMPPPPRPPVAPGPWPPGPGFLKSSVLSMERERAA
jgi:hypothetical protein